MLYNQIYLLNRDIFMYLFVYGTLISGESNHKTLGNSKLLGIAYTKGKLFDIGNYPALISDGDNDIKGEVYRIGENFILVNVKEPFDPREFNDFEEFISSTKNIKLFDLNQFLNE